MEVSAPATRPVVLYVITKATWGGAQRYVFDLIEGAVAAGYRPALAYGEPGLLAERAGEAGIPTHPVNGLGRDISFFGDVFAFLGLLRLFREIRPDIVHLNSSKAGAAGALAARIAGVPRIVFTAHGWAFTEERGKLARLAFAFIHYVTVLMTDVTIAVSAAVARKAERWPIARKRMRTVHLGIATFPALGRDEAREALAGFDDTLRLVSSAVWVGTIAELHPNKGIDVGIDAWKKAGLAGAHWVVLGGGGEEAKLRRSARESAGIHLLGFVPDAPQYLQAFDLFLLPSRTEALGYVLLEAGSLGIPALASNVGGIPEVVTEDVGYLFPRGDAMRLAAMLKEFGKDPERFRAKGPAFKKRVLERFTLERMQQETFALY